MSNTFYYPVPDSQSTHFSLQNKSLYIAFGFENYQGEKSLLEELGIDFRSMIFRVPIDIHFY